MGRHAGPGADTRTGVRLTSRNENDVSVSFPELQSLPVRDVLLDGEVVAFGDGIPTFGRLADRMHVSNPRRAAALAETNPVTLLVFDVLRIGDRDLSRLPLSERRELLVGLDLNDDRWQTPPTYDDGLMLLRRHPRAGARGDRQQAAATRATSSARGAGTGSSSPTASRNSYVVGGWRPETGSETRLGALLVGEPTADGLVYRGRVGSGIAGKVGPMLSEVLAPLARDGSPFVDEVPKLDALGTHWVEPVAGGRRRGAGADPAAAPPPTVVPWGPHRSRTRGPDMRRLLIPLVLTGLLAAPAPAALAPASRHRPDAARTETRAGARRRQAGSTACRVELRKRHPAGRDRQPHQRLPRAGHPAGPRAAGSGANASRPPRPDRLQRPGAAAEAARAGHRQDPARHLPTALRRSA